MTHERPPMSQATSEEALRAVTVGELVVARGSGPPGRLRPGLAHLFEREATRIRGALGDQVRLLEHVGSTSVPGLAAKPIIDIVLAVPDSTDEDAYVPPMEAAGYVLASASRNGSSTGCSRERIPTSNIHVFTVGTAEIDRMLAFRDWLRNA